MYKELLNSIQGIEIWPIISMFIFILIFALVMVWAVRMEKTDVAHYAALPLDDNLTGKRGGNNDV